MHRLFMFPILLSVGCAHDSKGPESALPEDGKEDSFRQPTEHGSIVLGTTEEAILTEDELFHTWDFELFGSATVAVEIQPTVILVGFDGFDATEEPTPDDLDTVAYLYRQQEDGGWGRCLRRNDDGPSGQLSRIEADLEAGLYRVLVKGHDESELGPFAIHVACEAEGCSPSLLGPPSLVVPLVSETTGERLADMYNEQMAAAGRDPLPPSVTVTSDDMGQVFTDAVDAAELAFDELGIEDCPMAYGLLDSYGPSLCYSGDGDATVGLVAALADSVFSDQFIVWAWRTPETSGFLAEEEYDEPEHEDLFAEYENEWSSYDPAGGALLLVYGYSDSGTDRYPHTLPRCQ